MLIRDISRFYLLLAIIFLDGTLAIPTFSDRLSKSKEILRYMNTSVNPCEDFYEFTCGNYDKYHSRETTHSMVREIMLSAEEKTKDILLINDISDSDLDRKIKDVYRSCLAAPKYLDNHPEIYQELSTEFGQMPALVGDNWNEQSFDGLQTVAAIKYKYGTDIIIDCTIIPDFTNNSIKSLYIAEANYEYDTKAIYLEEEYGYVIDQYKQDVKKNLKKYLKMDENIASKTANEIVEFEASLARGIPDNRVVIPLDELYVVTTISELDAKYLPNWNASEHILRSLGSIPPITLHINHIYQQNLIDVMLQTPKRIVANYIHYKFLKNFFIEFPKPHNEWVNQDICIKNLKRYYSKQYFNMIYRKLNLKDAEMEINEMWQHIKSKFMETLRSDRLNWQNTDTRHTAMEKLKAMSLSFTSYENYDFQNDVCNFEVDRQNFFNNLKTILKADGQKRRDRMNKPPQTVDVSYQISVTPGYLASNNVILIPISFLQPLYVMSDSYPNAYNFAVMGSALAHEMIHGFDDYGRGFDVHGNVRNWWDDESSRIFNERVKCFTNQYKQYQINGKNLPETSAQTENIADNGGIRLAYNAYMQWYNNAIGHEQELEFLPDLNYNHQQLFFISHSHFWCTTTNPNSAVHQADDTHTPEKFRIIGSLSNLVEFSQAFNCPVGSVMNPSSKCEIF